jgi:uncharacterized protein YegL
MKAEREVTAMKKNSTEIVMILDRSGSMCGLEQDTIGGYNSFLERQKKIEGTVLVSTVLFDDTAEVLHDRVELSKISPMTNREYYVRGCTALLDALGGAIHHIGNVHKYAREEDRPEHTIFVITTDGMENASRHYTFDQVRRMVLRQQEQYNWEFLFFGANMDAIAAAGRFGINEDRAVTFISDRTGTRLNYDVMAEAVSEMRRAPKGTRISAAWKKDIEEDFKKRQK